MSRFFCSSVRVRGVSSDLDARCKLMERLITIQFKLKFERKFHEA